QQTDSAELLEALIVAQVDDLDCQLDAAGSRGLPDHTEPTAAQGADQEVSGDHFLIRMVILHGRPPLPRWGDAGARTARGGLRCPLTSKAIHNPTGRYRRMQLLPHRAQPVRARPGRGLGALLSIIYYLYRRFPCCLPRRLASGASRLVPDGP